MQKSPEWVRAVNITICSSHPLARESILCFEKADLWQIKFKSVSTKRKITHILVHHITQWCFKLYRSRLLKWQLGQLELLQCDVCLSKNWKTALECYFVWDMIWCLKSEHDLANMKNTNLTPASPGLGDENRSDLSHAKSFLPNDIQTPVTYNSVLLPNTTHNLFNIIYKVANMSYKLANTTQII